MISKAFNTWFKQLPDPNIGLWSDFLTKTYDDHDTKIQRLEDSITAWSNLKSPDDLESYFSDNPDSGIAIADQEGEFTILHHLYFHPLGRIYGYATNKISDKPVELRLATDTFRPILPPFQITWNNPS
jgi:hypothetical protein